MARKRTVPLITDFANIPAEALVPEGEQPYEIPSHWKWVLLGSICNLLSGRDEPLSECNAEGSGIPYVMGASNLSNAGLTVERWIAQPKVVSESGDLLISVKGTVGKLYIQQEPELNLSRQIMAIQPGELIEVTYLLQHVSEALLGIQQRAVGLIPGISRAVLLSLPIPLPPIDEQKSVVKKLQSTNQKIDDVLDRLDQFLDQVPQQRASIIQAGVSGMLTEDWRAENGQSREDWVESTLGGTFRWASGGTPARSNRAYFQGHIPWIKSGELPDGLIDGVAEYITEDAISSSSAKVFPKDSVAIAMYGATIGRTGILAFDAATNQAVAVAAKNEEVDSRLLFYFLQASRERFVSLGKGGAQPNISQTVIKSFQFEYPVGDEQGEIVAVIEAALSGIETAYKITLDVREKVQAAKRAVRNRALRGIV
ncbi:restriction endonuclease subunit S [Kocuria marina]|uniref:restriction endonuclease subunit S n=1 Tax=Kocuria marina TaxID=223184 RepID=UPI00345F3E06